MTACDLPSPLPLGDCPCNPGRSPSAASWLAAAPALRGVLGGLVLAACASGTAEPEDTGPVPGWNPSPVEPSADAGPCQSRVRAVPNEGAAHVEPGSRLGFDSNPPASGTHYSAWAAFVPFASKVVPRGYWVHNLEHGGVVLLHGPDASEAAVAALSELYEAIPVDSDCDHRRALLTADPDLDDPIAVVAWDRVLEAECVDETAILAFVSEHRGRGPENVCSHGSFEP